MGLNFLTQVVTVRYLAKEDYGALAYALAMASFFGNISRFGMDKAVSRIAAIQDERRDYAEMFGTLLFAIAMVVVCGSAVAVGVIAIGNTHGTSFVTDPLSLNLLLILIALAPVQALDHLMQSVFAIFSKPQLIFVRKYVVGPCLKLAAVMWVLVTAGDAHNLAVAHLVAGVLGLAIGLSLAGRVLRERDMLSRFRWRDLRVRARRILGYGLPMLGSDAALLLRGALVVFLLEFWHGSGSVADFRAVLPVARLNNVALESFAFLFIPAVARLTAIRDTSAVNDMYWRSTTWVMILSLPIFLITFCLARPVTVLLFSERYAGAAIVLAVLSAGAYLNAVLSMSGHALKAAGRVRDVLIVDGAALALALGLTLALVPRHGALGGAVAVSVASVAHGITYHMVLTSTMDIRVLPAGLGRIYGVLGIVAGGVLLLDLLLSPPLSVQAPLIVGAWIAVLVGVAPQLQVDRTFPELLRVPVLGRLIEQTSRSGDGRDEPNAAEEIRSTLERGLRPFTRELGDPPHRAELRCTSTRPGSTIVECDVTGSEGLIPVLVKTVDWDEESIRRALDAEPDFPRLGSREHPATILNWERATLRAIHEHFTELDDPRFEPVRVFDVFPGDGIVAMERLPLPTLYTLIKRHSLRAWRRPSDELLCASANAGAWLRAFHAMPRLAHTEERHATRSDFIATLRDMSAFIEGVGGREGILEGVSSTAAETADRILPEKLPCGLTHGDYAPRNVLVGPEERVAVIDTPGRWWSATYLDVGYFVANTWTLMPSVLSHGVLPGTSALQAVERSFLAGYFGREAPDRVTVRLYEILTLLARWASGIHAAEHATKRAGPARQIFYRAREACIRDRLSLVLASLDNNGQIPSRSLLDGADALSLRSSPGSTPA